MSFLDSCWSMRAAGSGMSQNLPSSWTPIIVQQMVGRAVPSADERETHVQLLIQGRDKKNRIVQKQVPLLFSFLRLTNRIVERLFLILEI